MSSIVQTPKRDRWAHLRFSIIGSLLAAPPAPGSLMASLQALAAKPWRHPDSGLDIRFSTTTLGTPTAVYVQAATGFSTTAFGTPALRTPCNATGISTTAFGTVTVQMFGLATGLSDPTVFGTPSWTRLSSLSSTGLASTAGFGTPDCIENLQHARSHLSRTRFGAPTITRTAP